MNSSLSVRDRWGVWTKGGEQYRINENIFNSNEIHTINILLDEITITDDSSIRENIIKLVYIGYFINK